MNQLSTTRLSARSHCEPCVNVSSTKHPGCTSFAALSTPIPFIEVKDTSNLDIHATLSSEVEFTLYIQVVGKGVHA